MGVLHGTPGGEVGKKTAMQAEKLTYEYEKKLWEYDSRFHGTEERPDGRRLGQLEVQRSLGRWWPGCRAMALSARGSW